MAIGFQASLSEGGLNQSLGGIAVSMRDACQDALEFFANVNNLGTAGLEALGFNSTDATNFFNAANYLQTMATVYYGTAAQTPAFNFDSALAAARGGQ
jgi:hypothetical protein